MTIKHSKYPAPAAEPSMAFRIIITKVGEQLPHMQRFSEKFTSAKTDAILLAQEANKEKKAGEKAVIEIVRIKGLSHGRACRWRGRWNGAGFDWEPTSKFDKWHKTMEMFPEVKP